MKLSKRTKYFVSTTQLVVLKNMVTGSQFTPSSYHANTLNAQKTSNNSKTTMYNVVSTRMNVSKIYRFLHAYWLCSQGIVVECTAVIF